MSVTVSPAKVKGVVMAPPSKSMTHRAAICAALAEGVSVVRSPLIADDTEATRRVLTQLGVSIQGETDAWRITGGALKSLDEVLHCGESGTTLRLLTAICALVEGDCTLTGGPSLSRRPMEPLMDALRQLDVDCESTDGHPPVMVRGKGAVSSGTVEIRGDISSQFVSALLLVAPRGIGMTTVRITTPLESKPYVSMTMNTQKAFGVEIEASQNMRTFKIRNQEYTPADMRVEGDWSSAAFLLACGALTGEIKVRNLNPRSHQADRAISDILEAMGADVRWGGDGLTVKSLGLNPIEWDLSDSPDLFPVVASLCATADGTSTLRGLGRLRFKESDRIASVTENLARMGVKFNVEDDTVKIIGGKPRGAVVDPHKDHRIAMAMAVLGTVTEGETTILDAGCVAKSYPRFWNDLRLMGVELGE
jgi:3-phosphoshikimate 1-carboxyvinyltransferase